MLCAINVRLDAETVAFILTHGEARVRCWSTASSPDDGEGARLDGRRTRGPTVVDIDDALGPARRTTWAQIEYEAFLASGDPAFDPGPGPADEWDAIALNYTSGTTGNPKGVVYHHRGAYLNAVGNAMTWGMAQHPVYLWTLPMFHCNGWCFPWTVAAMAGTNVCLRRVEAGAILEAMDQPASPTCAARRSSWA